MFRLNFQVLSEEKHFEVAVTPCENVAQKKKAAQCRFTVDMLSQLQIIITELITPVHYSLLINRSVPSYSYLQLRV